MTDWTPVSPGDPPWTPADVENSDTAAAASAAAAAASAAAAADSKTSASDSATSAQSSAISATASAAAAADAVAQYIADAGTTGTGEFVLGTGPTISNPTISSPTITGHATIEGATLTGKTGSGKLVLDTSPSFTTGISAPQVLPTADRSGNLGSASTRFTTTFTQAISDGATSTGALLSSISTAILHGAGSSWTVQSFNLGGNEVGRMTGAGVLLWRETSSYIPNVNAEFYAHGGGAISAVQDDNSGSAIYTRNNSPATANCLEFKNSTNTTMGSVSQNGSAVNFNATSAYDIKMGAQALDAQAAIAGAKMYRGTYVAQPDVAWVGGYAHEMRELVPEGYAPSSTPYLAPHQEGYDPEKFDYTKWVPYLIAEVQRLQGAVAALASSRTH